MSIDENVPSSLADRIVDLQLNDILVVVPQLSAKANEFRQFVESEYRKSKGLSQEDCIATGKLWDGMPVDQRVMELMKIIRIHHDGIALNPKWMPVIKVAVGLRFGTREQRRALKRKLDAHNARTPFIDPSKLNVPQQ